MSDEITNPIAPAEPAAAVDPPIQLPDDHPLVKTLALQKQALKELREKVTPLSEKAKRLDELEEANKTELERVQSALAEAQETAKKALESKLRSDVAAAKGVPAGLLTGSTQEELEAAADALLAFKGTTPGAPSPDGQGKQGEPVGDGTQQLAQADLDRMSAAGDDDGIAKARAEGRFNKLLGITS